MNKKYKIFILLVTFAVIALLVYIAGEFALTGSPLFALIPVAIVLGTIVLYIRHNEK